MSSLYDLPRDAAFPGNGEFFEALAKGGEGLRVERIVSYGHVTPEGVWYDQDWDEWVAVLEGSAVLRFADGSETTLNRGEHVLLPRHVKHRVVFTSSPCIWLALHAAFLQGA